MNMDQVGMLTALLPFLGAAVLSDLAQKRIPNVLIALMLGCGVILRMAYSGSLPGGPGDALLWSAGGVFSGLVILLPFYAFGGMGAGDVKLLAATGAFLGPAGTALAGVAALLAGGVLAFIMISWRVLEHVAVRYGIAGVRLPDASPLTLPYSIAISAGVCASITVLQ